MTTQQSNSEFEISVGKIQAYMDSMVDEGSDQELFIAGYLSGHFSLVVSQCQLNEQENLETLNTTMRSSLENAFADNELELDDQKDALDFWTKCVALA